MTKKHNRVVSLVIAGILSSSIFTTNVFGAVDEQQIHVSLNGQSIQFDQQPMTLNGWTLVPMRTIFEKLGAAVGWTADTKTVTATKGNVTITMQVGNKNMTKNGNTITMEIAPVVVNSKVFVPVRAIAESFDCQVGWDASTATVAILSDSSIQPIKLEEVNKPEELYAIDWMGQSMENVYAKYGKNYILGTAEGGYTIKYSNLSYIFCIDMSIAKDEDGVLYGGKVTGMNINREGYVTKNIKVGMTVAEIEGVLGYLINPEKDDAGTIDADHTYAVVQLEDKVKAYIYFDEFDVSYEVHLLSKSENDL